MKQTSVYIFFLVLALTFWNPLTFAWVYRGTAVGVSHIMLSLFGVIFLLGLLVVLMLRKDRIRQKRRDIVFLFSFVGLVFAAVVGVNLLLVRKHKKNGDDGLVFPPHTYARYNIKEFDFTVATNELGLRDREIKVTKSGLRILCFGDSWTMGWGVSLENSWPKKLQGMLAANGINAEVINCGRGGASPSEYREFMAKTIPVLKPDIVLVGVLQTDDLAQMYENSFPPHKAAAATEKKSVAALALSMGRAFIASSFGNFALPARASDTIQIRDAWKASNAEIIKGLSPEQIPWYKSLNDTLRSYAESGDYNSGLLSCHVNFPNRDLTFNDPNNKSTQYALAKMMEEFRRMKQICDSNKAQMVFLSLPNNINVGHKVVAQNSRPAVADFLFQQNKMDSMYSEVAKQAQIPFFAQTAAFRALPEKTGYFYRFDGHPTPQGYEEIAKNICRFLVTNKEQYFKIKK